MPFNSFIITLCCKHSKLSILQCMIDLDITLVSHILGDRACPSLLHSDSRELEPDGEWSLSAPSTEGLSSTALELSVQGGPSLPSV